MTRTTVKPLAVITVVRAEGQTILMTWVEGDGRAVTLETFVKGEYVSVSVAARGEPGGGNRRVWAQADRDPGPVEVTTRSDNRPPPPHRTMRGRRASGRYHPGSHGLPSGGGEARMDCSGNKRGRK